MIDVGRIAPGLIARGEGLFAAPNVGPVSYPASGNAGCLAVEDDSFWFRHRNGVILDAIARHAPPGWLLDVGGGNGAVALALTRAGFEVAVLEPGADGIAGARARGLCPLLQTTLDEATLVEGSVPAAGLFDVLEHVADEGAWLGRLHAALAPGGRLYVTVPAFGWLWSRADEHAGHFRRHSPTTLTRSLEAAGFAIEHLTCFFAFLVAPIFVGRTLRDRLRTRQAPPNDGSEHVPSRWLRAPVDAIAAAERAWLAHGGRLGVGSSVLAVARRR
jgi:SAM-dependent methyltransferase